MSFSERDPSGALSNVAGTVEGLGTGDLLVASALPDGDVLGVEDAGEQVFSRRPGGLRPEDGLHDRRLPREMTEQPPQATPAQTAVGEVRERDLVEPLEVGFKRPPVLFNEPVEADKFPSSIPL